MNDIIKLLRSEQEQLLLSLVDNPASDYTSYRERVAAYNAITSSIDIILQSQEDD